MKFRRGLVVGKFCPLHRGHMLLIDSALAACAELDIISYTDPPFPLCGSAARSRWLQALYPQARIRVLPECAAMPHNDADGDLHRQFCCELLDGPVDAVFTSEDYGDGFAKYLGRYFGRAVEHVNVDQARTLVPVSGSAIRADPHAHRAYLHPLVYADLVERVAVLGAESSGKTTLAQALAAALGTRWVPEYGRERWIEKDGQLSFADMAHIGAVQCAREDQLAQQAARWLVCDTTTLTTAFYSEAMFGKVDAQLALPRHYAHTLLCAPDIPFEQDGTRQDLAFQARQHAWHLATLARRGIGYTLLQGSLAQRVAQALKVLR